jgi:hypothetical protein
MYSRQLQCTYINQMTWQITLPLHWKIRNACLVFSDCDNGCYRPIILCFVGPRMAKTTKAWVGFSKRVLNSCVWLQFLLKLVPQSSMRASKGSKSKLQFLLKLVPQSSMRASKGSKSKIPRLKKYSKYRY